MWRFLSEDEMNKDYFELWFMLGYLKKWGADYVHLLVIDQPYLIQFSSNRLKTLNYYRTAKP